MKILVTGGAGYIGSVVAEQLLENDYEVLVVDNLQQGHQQAVPKGSEFADVDISDRDDMDQVFKSHAIYAVMHLAADSLVGLSMTNPGKFFQNNVAGGLKLLDAMVHHDVHNFIFSSSAAIYGSPVTVPIEEDNPKDPVNAYGESKLVFERILRWYGAAHGLRHISLRYFNAAGASETLGEDHQPETHLIPNVLKSALSKNGIMKIFGTDYPTKDGTCVRDYVHVADIAKAHVLALEKLDSLAGKAYNLGNGDGYSVLEVVETAKRVIGTDIAAEFCPRRPGDPAVLVASSQLAREELKWMPEFPELERIIETAWRWLKDHPNGYRH